MNIENNIPFTNYVQCNDIPTSIEAASPSKKAIYTIDNLQAALNTEDKKQIKAIIRSHYWGLRHEVRKTLWMKLCKKKLDGSNIYEDMCMEIFSGAEAIKINLPSFVELTNTTNEYYLNEDGKEKAKKIVCVIGHTNPDITYAPTIYAVTMILLHYIEESECYNCVCSVLRSLDNFIPQTKVAYEVTQLVLKDLCKKFAKPFYSFLFKEDMILETLLKDWVWWILRDLPFSYVVRIFDCLLVEGPKILYRVALALLNLYNKHVVKANRIDKNWTKDQVLTTFIQFLNNIPVPVEKLLNKAFKLRGLSGDDIRRLTLKNEMHIRSRMNAEDALPRQKSSSLDSLKLKSSASFNNESSLVNIEMSNRKHSRSRSLTQALLPFTSTNSRILTLDIWQIIWKWLPARITLNNPKLVYTTSEHGTSLKTFYRYCDDYEPLLIIIKTTSNEIFGAYCSSSWTERFGKSKNITYFGTGETFIFTLEPKIVRYQWIGVNNTENVPNSAQLFLAGDNTQLLIGGGNGSAISLDENLTEGTTSKCDTFNNLPLSLNEDFTCANIEVFVFQ